MLFNFSDLRRDDASLDCAESVLLIRTTNNLEAPKVLASPSMAERNSNTAIVPHDGRATYLGLDPAVRERRGVCLRQFDDSVIGRLVFEETSYDRWFPFAKSSHQGKNHVLRRAHEEVRAGVLEVANVVGDGRDPRDLVREGRAQGASRGFLGETSGPG